MLHQQKVHGRLFSLLLMDMSLKLVLGKGHLAFLCITSIAMRINSAFADDYTKEKHIDRKEPQDGSLGYTMSRTDGCDRRVLSWFQQRNDLQSQTEIC